MTDTFQAWMFLSKYAHLLICLADIPHARLRDAADRVGISERSALRMAIELESADILGRKKEGRRNPHMINKSADLSHPIESHRTVGGL